MATQETYKNLASSVNSININGMEANVSDNNLGKNSIEIQWGFTVDELYRLALAFYKEKEGKAMHLKYQDKVKLVAHTKQVSYGKYRSDLMPAVGLLDVVGNDRRTDPSEWQAWQLLGDMSKEKAMAEFVKQLDVLCPLLRPYIQAHKTEKEEKEKQLREEEERLRREAEERERQQQEESQRLQDEEATKQQQLESQIRAALNQQTAIHFKQYAEQQHPSNVEQQETLIKQLQEQHYQQYMQQVYQQQVLHQQQQYQQLQAMANTNKTQETTAPSEPSAIQNHVDHSTPVSNPTVSPVDHVDSQANFVQNGVSNNEDTETGSEQSVVAKMPPLMPASIWTKKEVRGFKDLIKKNPENVIKIGSLATATVRVPTHQDGTCLFWEFATDYYDIGFGVYFEWTVAPSNTVSVHVSESSDEEDLDEEGSEGARSKAPGDIEQGTKVDNRPPTDEIIPVYRRDCHEEVYCGSHTYPGRGVYLLKFDNSYSLWRSKTLYYRVYYTR